MPICFGHPQRITGTANFTSFGALVFFKLISVWWLEIYKSIVNKKAEPFDSAFDKIQYLMWYVMIIMAWIFQSLDQLGWHAERHVNQHKHCFPSVEFFSVGEDFFLTRPLMGDTLLIVSLCQYPVYHRSTMIDSWCKK